MLHFSRQFDPYHLLGQTTFSPKTMSGRDFSRQIKVNFRCIKNEKISIYFCTTVQFYCPLKSFDDCSHLLTLSIVLRQRTLYKNRYVRILKVNNLVFILIHKKWMRFRFLNRSEGYLF